MHNCKNVLIENCFIRTFDDCICVKGFDCYYDGDVEEAVRAAMYRGGKAYDVFSDVTVRNCVLWNDWGKCLEIGAETRAEEIKNVVFENCDVIHVMGNVLDVFNVDYADVHDIVYQNINVEFDRSIPAPDYQYTDDQVYSSKADYVPPLIDCSVVYHYEYSAGGDRRGKIRNVTFKNINVFGYPNIKLGFAGYNEEHKVSNVIVENICVNGKKTDKISVIKNQYCENITII